MKGFAGRIAVLASKSSMSAQRCRKLHPYKKQRVAVDGKQKIDGHMEYSGYV